MNSCDSFRRWHSHCFSWGYGRLLSLLIRLPADLSSKQKMTETCRSHGYFSTVFFFFAVYVREFTLSYVTFCIMRVCRYWTGYIYLCCELQHRTEAFSTICQLDDFSLLEEADGTTLRQKQNYNILWAERRVHNTDVENHVHYVEIQCTCT